MRYRAQHIGRVRVAAAKILSKGLGVEVDPSDIKPATGSYRTDWRQDVYRWELFTTNADGFPIVAGCWWTLTDFVKLSKSAGFHFDKEEIYPGPKDA